MKEHGLNPKKTGIALAALLGGVHFIWALLILLGWAQGIVNGILWMHMVSLPVAINTFDFSVAILLVLVTSGVGYLAGFLFARVWNWVHGTSSVIMVTVPQGSPTPHTPPTPASGTVFE